MSEDTNTDKRYCKVLAWVTNPNACGQIIKSAKKIAAANKGDLMIVSIQSVIRNDWQRKVDDLEILNNAAHDNEAELTVLYSDNSLEAMFKCISHEKPTHMFCGLPGAHVGKSDFIDNMCAMADGADIYSVDFSGNCAKIN